MTNTQNRLAVLFIAVSACLSAYALAHAGSAVPSFPNDLPMARQPGAAAAVTDPSVPSAGAVFARSAAAAEEPAPTF